MTIQIDNFAAWHSASIKNGSFKEYEGSGNYITATDGDVTTYYYDLDDLPRSKEEMLDFYEQFKVWWESLHYDDVVQDLSYNCYFNNELIG